MKVSLKQKGTPLQYQAETSTAIIEVGANQFNGNHKTFRPMELILTGLASCSAIDIETILRKQKIEFTDFQIEVFGTRSDQIPGVFTDIDLKIFITGDIPESKLQRAIKLTTDKYCSVYKMLQNEVNISYSYSINS